MIDRALVTRLTLISAALLVLVAGVSFAAGGSGAMAGGLAIGFLLGAAPFLSWSWIAGRGLTTSTRRAFSALIVLAKLAVYAGLLYATVTLKIVSPIGVMIGLTLVVFTFAAGSLAASKPGPEARA